jgi:hypothetical protein
LTVVSRNISITSFVPILDTSLLTWDIQTSSYLQTESTNILAQQAATIGFYAFFINGISHLTSFSAAVATTRNPELDILMRGSSLRADPTWTNSDMRKPKFGPLLSSGDERKTGNADGGGLEKAQEIPHVPFGTERNVRTLRECGIYR